MEKLHASSLDDDGDDVFAMNCQFDWQQDLNRVTFKQSDTENFNS